MARATTRNCTFVKNGSISVVQSELTGSYLGCDVGLISQLAVWSYVTTFGREERGGGKGLLIKRP